MINVFPAVEAIYESHPKLRIHGRILREGVAGREHPPFTVVAGAMTEDLSTFGQVGTGLDIETWDLEFTLTSDKFIPDGAREWCEAMRDAFHDADVIDPIFKTAGCVVLDQIGPVNEDEHYEAKTTVRLTVQQDVLRPRTRH